MGRWGEKHNHRYTLMNTDEIHLCLFVWICGLYSAFGAPTGCSTRSALLAVKNLLYWRGKTRGELKVLSLAVV